MTTIIILTAWLGMNYLLMARPVQICALRDGAEPARAALVGLLWPVALVRPRRA